MPATREEKRYPFLKRYWRDIPVKGRISVMNKSWYSELADSFLEGEISEEEYDKRIVSVRNFERQLYDDGYIIIKFFLHIDSEEQKKRLKKLSENKKTRWRVTEKDRIQNKNYNKYLRTFKDMLSITDFPFAGWNIIDAQSRLFTKYAVFSTITEKIKNSLETFKPAVSCSSGYTLIEMPLLSEVELQGKTVSPERYPELLKKYAVDIRNTETLIENIRGIAGVQVAALIKPTGNPGIFKISLRSKNPDISVGRIARRLNGGGHEMAAGGTIFAGSADEAEQILLKHVEMEMKHDKA